MPPVQLSVPPRKQCVVLVPVGGAIEPACESSLAELERRGYPVWRVRGYSAIDQGRNQMATDALAAGFAETMWIDSDVGFSPDDVDRLRCLELPLVCAIYPKKGKRELAVHVLPGTKQITFGQAGGLMELRYAATGFLLVRRDVYEAMQADLRLPVCNLHFGQAMVPFFQPLVVGDAEPPVGAFEPSRGALPDNEAIRNTQVFPPPEPAEAGPASPWYLAEDFAFCERARRCGFKIWADTRVRLTHIGSFAYTWEQAGADPQRYATYTYHLTTGK
jgi:hypothetical protein